VSTAATDDASLPGTTGKAMTDLGIGFSPELMTSPEDIPRWSTVHPCV
jgi:hypothetical protein